MKAIKTMFSLLCVYHLSAEAITLKSKAGEVKFTAIGKPGFLKIRGESQGSIPNGLISIENEKLAGEFTFDLQSLKTGIELRDEHMKEKYLEVQKFPTAKLVISAMPMTQKDLESDLKKEFKGQLTLHGVTKEVTGKVDYKGQSKKIKAEFQVELSNFEIAIPEYMGITVSKTADIEVALDFEIQEKKK